GIAAPYLSSNRKLREDITNHGCLLSEYPPYEPATRYTFPIRNRLIAALSVGTVVVEAGAKSGSLITADCALEQGKDVFVVPGSIMSPYFQGSNTLITNGAITVFGGLDVLKTYERDYYYDLDMNQAQALHEQHLAQWLIVDHEAYPSYSLSEEEQSQEKNREIQCKEFPSHKKNPRDAGKDLSEPALRVYNIILDAKTILLADVIGLSQLPPHQVLRELTALEIEGLVEKGPAGQYTLTE
ncbi:MAG: DNA-processing protein DprA, partial [Clostridia bacterium]|nr:DNA-processing protein DprA [Clostridia bacterium]